VYPSNVFDVDDPFAISLEIREKTENLKIRDCTRAHVTFLQKRHTKLHTHSDFLVSRNTMAKLRLRPFEFSVKDLVQQLL